MACISVRYSRSVTGTPAFLSSVKKVTNIGDNLPLAGASSSEGRNALDQGQTSPKLRRVTVEAVTVLFGGRVTGQLRTVLLAGALAFGAASAGMADPAMDAVMKELVPTGKLRVAIAVAPAPSALYAIKDGTTGNYRGVTVELGVAMAKKLGVPVE